MRKLHHPRRPLLQLLVRPSWPSWLKRRRLICHPKLDVQRSWARRSRKRSTCLPTSNTSSMTTAITTYIQTPDNMMSLARRELPPSFAPNMLALPPPAHTAGSKSSKLAIKAKNSYAKSSIAEPLSPSLGSQHDSEQTDDNDIIYRNRHRGSVASPSSFASILVDEDTEGLLQEQRERYKQRKVAMLPKHLLSPTRSTGSSPFAFDQPSPDDIVMQARRGTALASRQSSQRSSGRPLSTDGRSRTSVPAVL